MTDLSIIIPCFNEAGNVLPLINELDRHLEDTGTSWEAIFIDDDSPDHTASVIRELAASRHNIRCIQRKTERGLASAVICGFQAAHGNIFIVMDADLQHDAGIIHQMYCAVLKGSDICIGSRFAACGSNEKLAGLASDWRNRVSRVGNNVLNFFLRRPLSDPLSGFFAVKRDLVMESICKLSAYGFKILFDLLYFNKNAEISEIHFSFHKRHSGESKLEVVVFWHLFCDLAAKILGSWLPPRLISFLAVGFLGMFVHFSVLFTLVSLGREFWMCQLFATLVAMTCNYSINNVLTYSDSRLSGARFIYGLLLYALASAIGIAANVGVAAYIFMFHGRTVVLSSFAGVVIDTIWRFAVANRVIWKIRDR